MHITRYWIRRRHFMWIAGLLAFVPVAVPAAELAGGPNMVVILADDLGYGDLSCNNPASKITTPPFCYLDGDRVLHLPVLKQPRMRDANFLATDEGLRSPDFTNYGVLPRLVGESIPPSKAGHPDSFIIWATTPPKHAICTTKCPTKSGN